MTTIRKRIFDFLPGFIWRAYCRCIYFPIIRGIFVNKFGVWLGIYDWCSGCECAYPKDTFKGNEYCGIELASCPALDKYHKRTYGADKAAELKATEAKLSPQEWGIRRDASYENLRVSFPADGMWKPGGKSVDGVTDVSFAVGPGETYAVGGAGGDVVCRLGKSDAVRRRAD